MQMINSTRVVKATRALKAVSRAPRSIVTRAVEPPQSPAPTGAAAPTPMMTATPPAAPPPPPPAPVVKAPTFESVMGFGGSPEIINGRLAMMGFVAALGAELSSGESVLRQLSEQPAGTAIFFALIIAASLIPAFANKKPEALGFLTPAAELSNGRFAMIGFAAMMIFEANVDHALFMV